MAESRIKAFSQPAKHEEQRVTATRLRGLFGQDLFGPAFFFAEHLPFPLNFHTPETPAGSYSNSHLLSHEFAYDYMSALVSVKRARRLGAMAENNPRKQAWPVGGFSGNLRLAYPTQEPQVKLSLFHQYHHPDELDMHPVHHS